MAEKQAAVGHIVQVIGPVLDVQFESGHLPSIYNAVRITSEGFNVPEPIDVTAEVQQHLGEGRVRAVAMEPTEGLVRGMKAVDTGAGITVPVGRPTLGRVMNVLGKPDRTGFQDGDQRDCPRASGRHQEPRRASIGCDSLVAIPAPRRGPAATSRVGERRRTLMTRASA